MIGLVLQEPLQLAHLHSRMNLSCDEGVPQIVEIKQQGPSLNLAYRRNHDEDLILPTVSSVFNDGYNCEA